MMRKALLLLCIALVATAPPPPFGAPRDEQNRVMQGYLDCDGAGPRSWVRTDIILRDPVTALAVAAHEHDHEMYVRKFFQGSCALYKKAVEKNRHIGVDMEARAFCRSVQVSVAAHKYTYQVALDYYSLQLSHYPDAINLGYDRAAVRKMIHDHCKVSDGDDLEAAGGAADGGNLRSDPGTVLRGR